MQRLVVTTSNMMWLHVCVSLTAFERGVTITVVLKIIPNPYGVLQNVYLFCEKNHLKGNARSTSTYIYTHTHKCACELYKYRIWAPHTLDLCRMCRAHTLMSVSM